LIIGVIVSHLSTVAMSSSPDLTGRETILLENGLILDWYVPPVQFSQDSEGEKRIEIMGFSQDERPGALRLPVSTALVAIPQGDMPAVDILQIEAIPLDIPFQLAFSAIPSGVLYNEIGKVVGGAFSAANEERMVENEPIKLESIGMMRGVHLARLVFHPVFSAASSFQYIKHIKIKLTYNVPQKTTLPAHDPVLVAIQSMVVNPQHIKAHYESPLTQIEPTSLPEGQVVAIEAGSTGLIAVTRADLQAIGYPVGLANPNNLHLSRAGNEIAYQWLGDADAIFENHESLLFFSEPRFSRWTNNDIYYLWQGESSGSRMDSRTATPTGLPVDVAWTETRAEVNTIYTPDCYCAPIPAGRDGDRWVWEKMQRTASNEAAEYNFSIELPTVDPAQTADLTLWLIGFTDVLADPDHLVKISINSNLLGEISWDGKSAINTSLSVPAGVLHAGENTVTLALPGLDGVTIEGAWLDAISLRYALGMDSGGNSHLVTGSDTPHAYQVSLNSTTGLHGYDVTDPLQPIALTGMEIAEPNLVTFEDPVTGGIHRYWLSTESEISPPTHLRLVIPLQTGEDFPGADYLLIAPESFIPALDKLVTYRESQGLRVAVEDIQAIYDAFGDGRPDPLTLQAYLAYAYSAWPNRPTYILLVGDGTSDPKRYQTASSVTYIPAYLAEVDPWAGETASDNRYVTIEGEDNLPEMLIGRLPANNLEEAQAMVSKIVEYESAPPPGAWSTLAAYISDNQDGAGDFPQLLESLVTQPEGPTLAPQRHYFDPETDTPEEFRNTLKNTWDFGNSLMIYAGHASIHQWAVENFIHLDDVPKLANQYRLPVLLELTCFTGSYQIPGFATLDEALLRHPNGGVVAAWGSTGLGISTGHRWLAEGFLTDTFTNPSSTLGSATLTGKLTLTETGFYPDLIDTYSLIGDPATQLFFTHSSFIPLIQR
jgi:hypothetical protein